MKKTVSLGHCCLIAAIAIPLLFNGCDKKSNSIRMIISRPVYSDKSRILAAINGNPAEKIDSAGKIYIKDQYIFLSEPNKGIFIIDNSDPRHPRHIAFLSIPGNMDIAVKGNILYADMYQDLLAIDISDPHHVSIVSQLPGFFSGRRWVNGYNTPDGMIITGWITKDTLVSVNRTGGYLSPGGIMGGPIAYSASASTTSATGTQGSMASMVLINNYLYAIAERHSLGVANVSNPSALSSSQQMYAGYDLETIYPFRDKLFLGSAEGVFIYDISNPAKPVEIGEFTHGRACDPVVVDSSYAYVTLHAGTSCGGSSNELDIVSIRQLPQTQMLKTYPMTKPMGLCKDGDLLFVCDGSDGVKIYNAKDPANLQLLTKAGQGQAYDVIASAGRLLIVEDNGLYQYDYSNISNIGLLSFIPVPYPR
ncbi:LVIVD repeat-containing protein [Puia dinghuensis]|uniref:LVIVD repeat-containing protein n=1 Tax=Puia dinghuensis TaxID=1792502 RepID=A0A8J2UE44_9BACT|nr:hypothetical protein [Puia dinghuensis]GGB03747.1 hypothetical protein GCM10011511_28820 [Puia dinghuensis]